ncbi:MAG: hypothetical protein HN590_02020 [Calditrichaeota bacterium]|jgi:heterodisulfide reductase subunit C2|nr:hypothetical protein [Deltaproteobacteria bacterium]MBT7616042.1 hypothetical protein [Calditrichota bacterium]
MKEALSKSALEFNEQVNNSFYKCIQCGYCSSFCAVFFYSEDTPRKIIRYLQCNDIDKASQSPFLRLCKQCLTCSQVCPQGVDVAKIMRRLVRHNFISCR